MFISHNDFSGLLCSKVFGLLSSARILEEFVFIRRWTTLKYVTTNSNELQYNYYYMKLKHLSWEKNICFASANSYLHNLGKSIEKSLNTINLAALNNWILKLCIKIQEVKSQLLWAAKNYGCNEKKKESDFCLLHVQKPLQLAVN